MGNKDLLNKFGDIEIHVEDRISSIDKKTCELHQKAYDAARASLSELAALANEAFNEQAEILFPLDKKLAESLQYLGGRDIFSPGFFYRQLDKTHATFVYRIVDYFCNTYNVSLDKNAFIRHFVPEGPVSREKTRLLSYAKTVQGLSLTWNDVVAEIFTQLGGLSFAEVAVAEIKEKSHKAAWNTYYGTKDYEQKKSVISFPNGCSKGWDDCFSLNGWMRDIMRAISLFENGSTTEIAAGLKKYFEYEFGNGDMSIDAEKLVGVKCFKNGRVDVRFKNEAFASQFTEQYLGTQAA